MEPPDRTIQATLEAYLQTTDASWAAPRVTELSCINAGWESDVYRFDLEHGPPSRREHSGLVLRVYPGADADEKSAREFNGMRLLRQAGYPVPEVFVLERGASPFGRPFVLMERIEGENLWPLLFHGPEDDQPRLLTLFCELIVRLHQLDWRPFVQGPAESDLADSEWLAVREMRRWEGVFAQHPLAGFAAGIDWLKRRSERLSNARPGPVHWDFHPNNVIIRADGAPFVIDWTQIDISDTRFDLGWTTLLVGSSVSPAWRDRILAEYERQWGEPVRDLDFFEAAAALKRLYSYALSVSIGAEHLGMRPGAEENMRAQSPRLLACYRVLNAITGARIPELDVLLGVP